MISSNLLALAITFAVAIAWLRIMDFFAHRGMISSSLSRKIIHAGTGLIFVLCWLLFDGDAINRYLAAIVPFGITAQFFLIGIGKIDDPASVAAMSRSGDQKEILRGPLIYGIVFVIATLVFWKESPVGIVALMLLCGGDGFADIIGKRIASPKIPWNPEKSLAGSLGMLAGSFLFSLIVLWVYITVGAFNYSLTSLLLPILLISLAGTIIETLPIKDFDNLTVPLAAVILGILLF